MKANEREFDASRLVVVVLPGQPVPQSFRPAIVCYIQGTFSPSGNREAVEVKPVVKSPHTLPVTTCPNIGKLVATAASLGDGLVVSVPITVIGFRTIVIGGPVTAPLCPNCQEERCRYAKVIKPNQTGAGGNVRGLSSVLHPEAAGGHKRGTKAQVLR